MKTDIIKRSGFGWREMGVIYILKFSDPIGSSKHTAQYYLGWTHSNLDRRLEEHRSGKGSRITRAAVCNGYKLEVIASFPGTPADESWYKSKHNHRWVIKKHFDGQLLPAPDWYLPKRSRLQYTNLNYAEQTI